MKDHTHIYYNNQFYNIHDISKNSVFSKHEAKLQFYPTHRNSDILILILLLFFILNILLKINKPNYIKNIIANYISINNIKKMEYSKSIFSIVPLIILIFISIVSYSIVYQILEYTLSFGLLLLYFYIIFFFIFKFISLKLFGYVLNIKSIIKVSTQYYFNFLFLLSFVSVFLGIIYYYFQFKNLFIEFNVYVYFSMALFFIMYVYMLSSLYLFFKKNYPSSSFHIILYLCTFEFLPILILSKYLITN